MNQNQPREPLLRGCGPLILIAVLILISPYLAFLYSLRTQAHRRDAEQFYAARIDGYLRLPSERQIRVVTEKPGFMGGGYYTVRFTLPASRTPEAWIREIGDLNGVGHEPKYSPRHDSTRPLPPGTEAPTTRAILKKWSWDSGSRHVAYERTSGEYLASFAND